MAKEKQFENKVKEYLKNKGCWLLKYWGGGGYTKKGIPDLLVCCNGYFLAIELKAEDGKPSELQEHTIKQILNAGGISMVLYPRDFETLKSLIDNLLKNPPFFDAE